MSAIFRILNISDTERAFVSTIGQEVVFDAVNTMFKEYNDEVVKMTSCFVDRKTEAFSMRYLLPGGGKLQKMGGMAPAPAVVRSNKWDVSFPLYQWGAEQAGDRVDLAYMSIQELDAHLDTIMIKDLNTMRWRILTAIFENTNLAWTDPVHGALTIRRLANDDAGTLYPPVVGSETEANDNHYSLAGYAVSAIDITNNPAVTLRDEIVEHFGGRGSADRNMVVFHANDSLAYLAAIAGYTAVPDQYIVSGVNTAVPQGLPNVPGRVHGRLSGCWLSEWDGWIPDTYMIGLLLEVPPPLMMRVDPVDTGLGQGLQLVATDVTHPMQRSSYEHRYGLGCGNRLSAAVIQVDEDSEYSPPSAYSE